MINVSFERGISHKYPFFEGDLPENTRYVRLSFGLKGAGTMWIDDGSFGFKGMLTNHG